jgi:hypothetical protein
LTLSRLLLGDDQVDGHNDLLVEAGPVESRLPDARLVGECESGTGHHIRE